VLATWHRRGVFGAKAGAAVTRVWRELEQRFRFALLKVSFVPDHVHVCIARSPRRSAGPIGRRIDEWPPRLSFGANSPPTRFKRASSGFGNQVPTSGALATSRRRRSKRICIAGVSGTKTIANNNAPMDGIGDDQRDAAARLPSRFGSEQIMPRLARGSVTLAAKSRCHPSPPVRSSRRPHAAFAA